MYKLKLKIFYIKQIFLRNAKLKFRYKPNGILFATNGFGYYKLI